MNLHRFLLKLAILTVCLFHCEAMQAQDAKTYAAKGDEAFGKNRFDEAIEYYTKAIKEDDKFAMAYANRGYSYIWHKKMNEILRLNFAIRDCSKAIELQPDSASFYYYRSEAFAEKGWADSAIVDLTEAIRLGEAQLSDTKNLIEYYEKRAALYKGEELYYPAIEDYKKLIILDTGNVDYYRHRFIAYYNTNQIDLALQDVSKCIELRPTYYGYYNNRGLCYNSLGEYELAKNDFLTNLNYRLDGGNPYINIISPLVRLNRFSEANFFYNLYLNNKNLYENLPRPKGLPSFLDEPSFKFYKHFIKAVTHVNYNKQEEALRSLDSASLFFNSRINDTTNKTRRGYMDVLYLRGYILEKQGLYAEAKTNFEQSLVIDPRQPDIREALQRLQLSMAKARTRGIDKTLPVINGLFIDTVKTSAQDPVTDSITVKIRGTATDESGMIQLLKINDLSYSFEEDGFFRHSVKKKNGDSSNIIITVIDSANNSNAYTISNDEKVRGGKVSITADPTANPMGKYYAILIAEKDYVDDGYDDLQYPVIDANNLKTILIDKYTFDAENIDTLYNRSREDILEAIIARCKALDKKDNLLIFYAGHGDTTVDINKDVNGYLVPTSAKKGLTSYNITSEEIKKALLTNKVQHVLLLLDACYSGTFTRGEDDKEVKGDVWKQLETPSRKVMTSGNVETVPDKSFFIRYVTEFLTNNQKDYVSANDLWEYVYKGIRDHSKETGSTQYYSPQYAAITGVGDKGGAFIFERRK
jgi:tetratricopeptide (TPR) repeat protein